MNSGKHLIILLLILLVGVAATQTFAAERVTIRFDDGRRAEVVSAERVERDSEELYLRANQVAKIFRATQFWNASARKVVLGIKNTRFVLTVDTRVVLIEDELIMLKNPVRYRAGFVMIPFEFILEIASHYTPLVFSWDADTMVLSVTGTGYNVRDINIVTTGDQSTATLELSEPLVYHMDANTPGLVRLKLYGGRIDPRKFLIKDSQGLFDGVRAEQTERDAYVYFDIKKFTTRVRVEKSDEPPTVTVILERGELPEIPEPDFAGKKGVEILDESETARKYWDVKKIAIDPGHGGKDYGKVGSNGTLEKDVNLLLAREIAAVLTEELGLEVVLTREDDRLLSLTGRAEIANEYGADLFLSIHCNGWFTEDISGFEAYFLSPAQTDYDKSVAQAENESARFSGKNGEVESDINFILWDMVQNEFISESSYLAELVQKEMSERLDIGNRGVKQANFTVLQGAKMPAVLIETAFLSNPAEERLLQEPSFHRKVAVGIGEAIKKFIQRYQYRTSG